jgi:protein transport protein SEC24
MYQPQPINPYPGQSEMPPQGWPGNINQQMANMNLSGPPKQMNPMQTQQPNQQTQQFASPNAFNPPPPANFNTPTSNQMINNNNNSFPPMNGTQNVINNNIPNQTPIQSPQGAPPQNKMPPSNFPPTSSVGTPAGYPPQNLSPKPLDQRPPIGVPQINNQQPPQQMQQRQPPLPGQQQQQMPGQQTMVGQQSLPPQHSMQGFPQQPSMGRQSPMAGPPQPGLPPMNNPQQPPSGMMPPPPGSMQNSPQMGNPQGYPGSMGQRGPQYPPMPGQVNQQQLQQPGYPPMPGPPMNQNQAYPPMPGQGNFNQQSMSGPNNMYNNQQNQYPPQPGTGMYGPPGQPGQPQNRGYANPPSGQPQYPTSPMGAVPQRRLDPDQMPNPIQVMSENQRASGGVFATNQVGQVPPLVTTKFVTQDQGNTGPRFLRSSMYSVPATTDMMKQSAIPFSIVVSPFARLADGEMQPPIVDMGEVGPIRCVRCKAYMSPHMQFIDAGRRFHCVLCKATTEVPAEYFQHLDHTGQRVDKYERPELVLGTYEFVATKDYCRNSVPPKAPAMIFVIDVSYNNVKSGLVHLLCKEMREIVKNLPIDVGQTKTAMKVGFITYNNTVHFYNLKSTLAQPQMMVVGDVQDMFMPLLDGFLVDPEESSVLIDLLMEQIPKMFSDTRETETILLPAIQAGLEALKASECVGKLLIFHSSLPIADAPGKLKNRDDRKLLATEKEKTVLTPQVNTYNNLGQECALNGCSVDLFIFNNAYVDLATIGQVARLTGGEIYKYTYFQADLDGNRVVNDVIKNISRPIAFDSVMRVRTSTGIRPTDFYGHFFMSNATDMEIASIDSDKSIAIEIKHDDKLPPEENVYIQVALLYTSCSGQRRLRVLNLSLKTCTQLADLFRSCDLDTTILFFAKQGIFKLLEHTPKVFRDNLINRTAQILACYRKNCASPTSAGQLILPECLKLLPLYVSCLLKNDAFSGGSDITLDDRSYVMYYVCTMDLPTSVVYFYPRLIPIHNLNVDETDVPAPIRCTIEKMSDDGAYILDNGIYMFLWLGIGLSHEFTQSVFGAQTTQLVDTDRCGLPIFDNALSKRVRGVVDTIQRERHRCMRIALVKQRDKLETVLRHFLIEDRGTNGTESYVDFLCHMHKEIRALLS